MLNLEFLKQLLMISTILSTITCAVVQKTKMCFKTSKYICLYSFIINILIGIIFCDSFTTLTFPINLWVGFFSFIESDTIYKSLEGKLTSHSDLITKKNTSIKNTNITK